MRIAFRITASLLDAVRADLARPHPFALERVGFLACRFGALRPRGLVIVASDYCPVADEYYLDAAGYGALMGPAAIRAALEHAYNHPVGMFHVHVHAHRGAPALSAIDVRETARFVPDFFHVRPDMPHGAIVLSLNSACGRAWLPTTRRPTAIRDFAVVGTPMRFVGRSNG